MRILLAVNSMQFGGAERVAAALANAWAARGDLVTLVIADSLMRASVYPLHPAVSVKHLQDRPVPRVRRGIGDARNILRLRQIIRETRATHAVSFTSHLNLAAIVACIGLNVAIFAAERTYPPMVPLGFGWSSLRRLLYPFATKVVMQTQDGLRWMKEHIPAATGVVIPNPAQFPLLGTGENLSPNRVIDERSRLLLAVGRLDDGKQFDHLVQAFACVVRRHPGWKLVILGEGPERLRLEALIQQLGLGNDAFLPGRAGNVSNWYLRASLFAMTSRFEGFPNALLEALAHGCPAVAYDCDTGPRDIIRDGVDGLLVGPVGNIPQFTRSLQSLMQDEALRLRMAANALAVRDRFSMETVLDQWQKLFENH